MEQAPSGSHIDKRVTFRRHLGISMTWSPKSEKQEALAKTLSQTLIVYNVFHNKYHMFYLISIIIIFNW